jgi:two-component system, OmpR family, copper resistance phosphate regulon response regulator CusR
MRILVVEGEKKVAKALRDGLEAHHYDVDVAATGEDGFFLVGQETYDLVLLDLMLPKRDGLEVLTALRRRGLQTPGNAGSALRSYRSAPQRRNTPVIEGRA